MPHERGSCGGRTDRATTFATVWMQVMTSASYVESRRWGRKGGTTTAIDTVVLGHEQVVYVGNGEWQPLDETAN